MAGRIKFMIDQYVDSMSNGNETIAKSLYTRLALQGIIHSKHTAETPDDPVIMAQLYKLGQQANISL